MADGYVVANPGAGGAQFAKDNDGTGDHPYVKLEWGASGTQTKVAAGASALPIQDGGNVITVDGTVAVSGLTGTVAVTQSGVWDEVGINDSGNSITVDGVFYQATQPISAAALPLPSGAATLAGQTQPGVDIGDVTVNNAAGAAAVNIQDGGNSITIDGTVAVTGTVDVTGTVTANAGTNLNTSSLALEAGGNLAAAAASLAVLDNIVAGSEAQVDIVAALPAGTNNIGDVDVASIAAGDNNIGNVDVVTLPALPAGTNLIGYVGHGKTIKTVSGSLTADTDVIALVAAKRLKVIAYSLTGSGVNANTVIFKSNGTAGTELWRLLMQSSASIAAGANLSVAAPSFLFATVAGEKLTMDVNQTDAIHYSITYFDDDAT